MREILMLLPVILWMTQLASAQPGLSAVDQPPGDAIASIVIYPEDVAQDSIQRFRMATNKFVVRWQYTEEGAKKMRALWDAHAGKRVRTRVGKFASPPARIWPRSPAQTNNIIPWEKTRTDKFIGVSEKDAEAIVAGLRKR